MDFDYQLLVIGAGSSGLAAAQRATSYGATVAIAEHFKPGGACVNYGCIPEKLLDYAASFRRLNKLAVHYGWGEDHRHFHWSQFVQAEEQHIQYLNELHLHHIKDAKITFLDGHARFVDEHTLTIGEHRVTAEKILISVGAKPVKPNIPGIDHTITWHELYHLREQPETIAVIGGDPIGVKVAGSLNSLGTQVTQIVREERLLPLLDEELVMVIQDQMQQHGIQLLTQTHVEAVAKVGDRLCLSLANHPDPLRVDTVLMDARRVPNLDDLHLAAAQVQVTPAGTLQVDEFSRTNQPHIFAVGDCTGRMPLTPSAIAQGRAFAETEFGPHPQPVRLDWVPMSLASHPEAATLGLSEAQARERFGEAIACYRTQFRPLFYAPTEWKNEKTFIKVVVNRADSERVLGIHMVGTGAVDIVQSLTVALKLGATKRDLDTTIGIHPSSAEELFSL